jgi:hypothetical protein
MREQVRGVGLRIFRSNVRRLAAALGVALCSVAGMAHAQERLVLEPYPATEPWKEVTHKTFGAKFLIEDIPADQVAEDYRDILSAQSFPELRGYDPSRFLSGLFARAGATCENVRVNGPKAQIEANYAVAYGQKYCGRQLNKTFGVQMFYKVIQGQDALYLIIREAHVPASDSGGAVVFSKDQAAEAIGMLKSAELANQYLLHSVYLCGGVSNDPRCGAAH